MRLNEFVAVVLLGALSLPGLAFAGGNEAATATYASQVEVAAQREKVLEDEVSQANDRIAQLEESVRQHGQTEANRLENLDQVNSEVDKLRGQLEEINFKLDAQQKTLDTMLTDDDKRMLYDEKRIAALENYLHVRPPPVDGVVDPTQVAGSATAPVGTSTTAPTGTPTGTPGIVVVDNSVPPPTTAQQALDQAVEAMKAGRQGVARAILQKAVDDYPNDKLIAEIRYRIAESYFNEQNWGKAATAFDTVVNSFPKSDWAAWSMERQGECFDQLNKSNAAQLFYNDTVTKYPKSDAAKEARKHIK